MSFSCQWVRKTHRKLKNKFIKELPTRNIYKLALMKWYHCLTVFSLPFLFYCVIKLSQSNHRYCWFLLLLLLAHYKSMPIFANATQFLVLHLLRKMLRCWMNYMPNDRIFYATYCNNTIFNFYYVKFKITRIKYYGFIMKSLLIKWW